MNSRIPTLVLLLAAAGCADAPGLPDPAPSAAIGPGACLVLPAGGARTISAGSAADFCVGADTAAAEYALVVGNGGAAALPVTVLATGVAEPDAAAARRAAAEAEPLAFDLPDEELPPLGAGGPARPGTVSPAAPPAVGTLLSYNVRNGCPDSTRDMRTGRVVAVGSRVVVVQDTAAPMPGFGPVHWASIAAEFDTLAYPVVASSFGTPTDLDGNGRIVAFYTPAVNELTAPGASHYTGGFIRQRDLLPRTVCRASNQAEVLFMLVPDPFGIVNSNVRTAHTVRRQTVGLLAHELQHVVNAGSRIYHPEGQAPYEVSWLNEGLSHVAEELVFYRAAGLRPGRNLGPDNLRPTRVADALQRYQASNLARLRLWMQRPELALESVSPEGRGGMWSFLRYAADRRGGDPETFWRSLVGSRTTGRANLGAAIHADPQVWWREWLVASHADDWVRGLPAAHRTPSWNLRGYYGDPFPLAVRALAEGSPRETTLSATGAGYFGFGVDPGGMAMLSVTSGGGAVPAEARIVVVRVR